MTDFRQSTWIVLCNPADARNVGGAIRAVTNAGLAGTRVVTQAPFTPRDLHCYSSGSMEFADVSFFDSVEAATADCVTVIGTSRRTHDVDAPPYWPAAGLAQRMSPIVPTAILFGAERTGLLKSELDRCSAVVCIPTSETYPSMNLAHAVACIGYELARPTDSVVGGLPDAGGAPQLSAAARDAFFGHVEKVLTDLSYPPGKSAPAFVRRLRKILHRANLNQPEMSMLGGIFTELGRLGRLAGATSGGSDHQDRGGDQDHEGHEPH